MRLHELTPQQRFIRQAIRNYLLVATPEQKEEELRISQERGDQFRTDCIREIIEEDGPRPAVK